MLDIAAARNGFLSHEKSNIGLVRSLSNFADGLTKPTAQAALWNVLQSSTHPLPIQWIIRH